MLYELPNIENALQLEVLVDNPNHREDQELVNVFIDLIGVPSRPIDPEPIPRSPHDFTYVRRKLPDAFFEPFNRLLNLFDLPTLRVVPDLNAIKGWNHKDFMPNLVANVTDALDRGGKPRLVPTLVSLFYNLERQRVPSEQDWGNFTAITVPGSRTYDRAAEAFRAYVLNHGKAPIITSGKAPYYDPDNAGFNVTEAEANAAYLRLLGVPSNKIYMETDSKDTVENVDFLVSALSEIARVLDVRKHKVLLVTSPFHLARYRLNIEMLIENTKLDAEIFAIGSKASRYWAETYFVTDKKSGYTRERTMGHVFNEYLKLAFDLCTQKRPTEIKPNATR